MNHDVTAQVEAVLDILAPKRPLPPGMGSPVRVPLIFFELDGRHLTPTDAQLRALAERIVTAIRTVSSQPDSNGGNPHG